MKAKTSGPRTASNVALATLLAASLAAAAPASAATTAPKTVVLDGPALVRIRSELGRPTEPQRLAKKELLKRAQAAAGLQDYHVVGGPPGPREYYSQAPYWWDCRKPPGGVTPKPCFKYTGKAPCPNGYSYVQYDGKTNPEIGKYLDHGHMTATLHAIYVLSLAWFYTGDQSYANKAESKLRAWFLDPANGMKPEMPFAQMIPCHDGARGEGILESSERITQVIDALALLDSGAPGWTPGDQQAMKTWLTAFSHWMETSEQGHLESAKKNNHGSWKDLQDAVIESYLGNAQKAHDLVSHAKTARIDVQIATDGHQPLETVRTRSWHYSNFNATALCRLAEVGRHVDAKLWTYVHPGPGPGHGGSLPGAINFLIPAFVHNSAGDGTWWPFPNIRDTDAWPSPVYLLHAADEEAGDMQAHTALTGYTMPEKKVHGVDMWPLVPACSPIDEANVDNI